MQPLELKNLNVPDGCVSVEKYEKLRKDFEEFVYIISHDLQAPLRHTREFNKLLLRNMKVDDSSDQKLYLDNIQLAVDHAEAMIDGMLKYSRLNTQVDVKSNINVNELIDSVFKKHTNLADGSLTDIKADPLPKILANEPMIEQLFSILIENSLKYRKQNNAPTIEVSSRKIEIGYEFSIEDNGIGMSSNTRNIAFEIFRPIRKYTVQSGIGIGLTIAKKIVECHGGNIWIDPEYSGGTRVSFTIACVH